MFIKTVGTDDWDYGEASVQMLKMAEHSNWKGSDFDALVKRAGTVFANRAKEAKFYPGEIPMHSIALGATEFWGANRNGDGFNVETCIDCHPTFKKFARIYENHKNTDPSKSFGVIKLAAWNDEMKRVELLYALNGTKEAAERNKGLVLPDKYKTRLDKDHTLGGSMACWLNDRTLILTKKNGFRWIKSIQVGDEVLTHTGQWQPVTEVIRRTYIGTIIHLHLRGVDEVLTVTADHPFFVARQTKADVEQHHFDWMHAGCLAIGDLVHATQVSGAQFAFRRFIHDSGFWPETSNDVGYCEVVAIESETVIDVPTYNLEVAVDHSYCAHGISSHNCKIAFDVCQSCGNKAKTRAYYCDESACPDGGCKNNLGKIASSGKRIFVENPGAVFFDYSLVGRPADPTAYGRLASYVKAAAAGAVQEAAQVSEVSMPVFADKIECGTTADRLLKLAYVCADAEKRITADFHGLQNHVDMDFLPVLYADSLGVKEAGSRVGVVLDALTNAGIVLPPAQLLQLLHGRKTAADHADAVAARLPGAYSRLLADQDALDTLVSSNPFTGVMSQAQDAPLRSRVQKWAYRYEADLSFKPQHETKRTIADIANSHKLAARPVSKLASVGETDQHVSVYLAYQLSALDRMAADGSTVRQVIRQNHGVRCNEGGERQGNV